MDTAALLDAPLGDLMADAARLRDAAHGARVTFSPKVFIPLTMLCRDRCGYCTFAKPPAHLDSPYLSLDDVPQAFAALVAEEAPRSIALSGGDTARACYELLADADVEWSRVTVLFGDERWVPVDDPDSNEGMARRVLLDHVEPHAIHSMRKASDTWEGAASAYDALLRGLGAVGLVHLGLGPDGHTASLFPGSPALGEQERLVVTNPGDATHPHDRLTFTFPAIAQAELAVFTIAGSDKRDAFSRIRAGDDLPATHVTAQRVIWLVDPAAMGSGNT